MAKTASASGTNPNGRLEQQPNTRLAFDNPTAGVPVSQSNTSNQTPTSSSLPYDISLSLYGRRSLANIGIQAFGLGFTFAAGVILGPWAAYHSYTIWRLFTFLAVLSVFHFLEYWTTARYHFDVVKADSFLLFTNGKAYNIASALAITEILLSSCFPRYGRAYASPTMQAVGILLVLLGQIVRSSAMVQAGVSFNHLPQKTRKDDHVLVTSGIYRILRHPSYFGFFWWAIGTQLLAGNKVCLVAYPLVLWKFFSTRIAVEEKFLVEFFGDDYRQYRSKTLTGMPFIR